MLVLAISQRKTRRSSVGLRNKQTKKTVLQNFFFFLFGVRIQRGLP